MPRRAPDEGPDDEPLAAPDPDAATDGDPVDGDDGEGAEAHDDAATTHDAEEDDAAEDEDRDEDGAPRPRRALDGRTLLVCALVALVAALAAGLLVSRFTSDGGDDDGDSLALGELTPAEQAPDVALTRFDGSATSLGDYAGQPLVVNFWGSWCQPCVDEMPDLEEVHQAVGEDVTFLGVNIQDEPEAAQALADRTGVTYDLVRDVDGELTRALGVTNFPTTVLILPDGTVVDTIQRKVSADRLCEKVGQSLLGGTSEACG